MCVTWEGTYYLCLGGLSRFWREILRSHSLTLSLVSLEVAGWSWLEFTRRFLWGRDCRAAWGGWPGSDTHASGALKRCGAVTGPPWADCSCLKCGNAEALFPFSFCYFGGLWGSLRISLCLASSTSAPVWYTEVHRSIRPEGCASWTHWIRWRFHLAAQQLVFSFSVPSPSVFSVFETWSCWVALLSCCPHLLGAGVTVHPKPSCCLFSKLMSVLRNVSGMLVSLFIFILNNLWYCI